MKVSVAVLVSALAAVGLARPAITNTVFDVQEGEPFTLTWIDAVGPVKVELLTGADSNSLNPIQTLTTSATGGSFTWTPEDIVSGNYAFRVTDSTGENYSLLFPIVGTATPTSASGTTRSTSATRSASSESSVASSSAVSSSVSSQTTSSSATTTTTPTTTRNTAASTPTVNMNGGQRFSSSLALVFMTAAALVFFN